MIDDTEVNMKRALIIGNQNYSELDELRLPTKDASKMDSILKILGYETYCFYNLNFYEMKKQIEEFSKIIADGDQLVFYFSGHGYSFEGHNYITPIDCVALDNITYNNSFFNGFENASKVIDMEMILRKFEQNKDGDNIIMIDACRNIYGKELYKGKKIKELVEMPIKGSNTFISFATTLGFSAHEYENRENSIYMELFAKFVFRTNQTVDELFECITDYMNSNYEFQIPYVVKNNKQTISLVDNTNYSLIVEKQYYKDLFELYSAISVEVVNSKKINEFGDIDGFANHICNTLKGYVYYPSRLLKKLVRKVIVSLKDDLGILRVLTEEELFTRIDINAGMIFIEGSFGYTHTFKNEQLYLLDNFERFVTTCNKKDSLVYAYNDKTILRNANGYQLINNYKFSLKELIITPLSVIATNDNYSEVLSIIIDYIQNNKSILLVGTPFTNKEEIITACTEYFSSFDRIAVINEDKNINVLNGHVAPMSTNFDEVLKFNEKELKKYIKEMQDEKVNRLIYQNKSFRLNDQSYFNTLDSLNTSKLVSRDYNPNSVEILLETISPTFDLVIVLEVISDIGSAIIKTYTLENGRYKNKYETDIDYNKLDRYRNLLNEI